MHEDFDDTVLVPARRHPQGGGEVDEDTLVPERRPVTAAGVTASPAVGATASAVPAGQKPAAGSAKTTTKHRPSKKKDERRPPTLVEPAAKQRRVPLTHKRLQETLRVPAASHESGILPAGTSAAVPAAVQSAYGFRIGDRPAVILDVPALVGRRPTAPRIPGRLFPRLVRVSSPLNEVSSTHLELRQDGMSVIVTDLRSTNGTVVRMPGSRPVKLRQGESLVVRPGSLVDIGDGNVIEILPPPRLAIPGDATGERGWS